IIQPGAAGFGLERLLAPAAPIASAISRSRLDLRRWTPWRSGQAESIITCHMTRTSFVLPIESDPCEGLVVEQGPDDGGVGSWVPEKKHTLLAKLLGGTRAARAKWSERIFIDPFCGPGRIRVKGEFFTRDGGAVVAWRQSLTHNCEFTRMFIG